MELLNYENFTQAVKAAREGSSGTSVPPNGNKSWTTHLAASPWVRRGWRSWTRPDEATTDSARHQQQPGFTSEVAKLTGTFQSSFLNTSAISTRLTDLKGLTGLGEQPWWSVCEKISVS